MKMTEEQFRLLSICLQEACESSASGLGFYLSMLKKELLEDEPEDEHKDDVKVGDKVVMLVSDIPFYEKGDVAKIIGVRGSLAICDFMIEGKKVYGSGASFVEKDKFKILEKENDSQDIKVILEQGKVKVLNEENGANLRLYNPKTHFLVAKLVAKDE